MKMLLCSRMSIGSQHGSVYVRADIENDQVVGVYSPYAARIFAQNLLDEADAAEREVTEALRAAGEEAAEDQRVADREDALDDLGVARVDPQAAPLERKNKPRARKVKS